MKNVSGANLLENIKLYSHTDSLSICKGLCLACHTRQRPHKGVGSWHPCLSVVHSLGGGFSQGLNVVMSGTRQTPGLAVSELEFRCSQEGRAWETGHTHRAPVELITASGMKCGGMTCTEEAALSEQSKFLPLPGWDPGDQSLTQDTEGAWSKCGCAKGLWASPLLLQEVLCPWKHYSSSLELHLVLPMDLEDWPPTRPALSHLLVHL